jgi:hypothetical protein
LLSSARRRHVPINARAPARAYRGAMPSWRPRLTYANVAATLALLLAMGGGAFAATHYLITSTKQISPRVLSQLRGKRGPAGKTGKTGKPGKPGGKTGKRGRRGPGGPMGPPGPIGIQGPDGSEGKKGAKGLTGPPGPGALSPLPSGESESGLYGMSAGASPGNAVFDAVTFPVILALPIPETNVIYVRAGATKEHCAEPGTADRGYICLYSNNDEAEDHAPEPTVHNIEAIGATFGAGPRGFVLEWNPPVANSFDIGRYTVTAP